MMELINRQQEVKYELTYICVRISNSMVIDKQYQHLIAWNYTGTSFIVCNIMEFSRDVLPSISSTTTFPVL